MSFSGVPLSLIYCKELGVLINAAKSFYKSMRRVSTLLEELKHLQVDLLEELKII
jgi:hypothetical protein